FVDAWKAQYLRRIADVDAEIGALVDSLEYLLQTGDVALAVLSDHGFLFGEYGFVGKPANTPLPPQLFEIVCWLSSHFGPFLAGDTAAIQPHILHRMIRQIFAVGDSPPAQQSLHVFGRNSPRSAYISAATEDDIYIGSKVDGRDATFSTINRLGLDPRVLLARQGVTGIPDSIRQALSATLTRGRSEW